MLNLDMLLKMELTEIENPNLFPFPFGLHIVFAIIALVFFVYRFFTDKKPFQLIFAIAVPFSLTLWLSDSRTWFYTVGAIELVFIAAAAVTALIFRNKTEDETSDEEKTDAAEASDNSESDSEKAESKE